MRMIMQSAGLALAAVAILSGVGARAQGIDFARTEIKTQQIAPNFYVLTGSADVDPGHPEAAGGRIGVLVGPDGVLLVDAQYAPLTDKVVAAIRSGRFDVMVLNYANTDMVGHTGKLDAAIKAVETVDACLGRLSEAVEHAGGTLVITADHGNAEMMRDPKTGEPHTAHTLNPVPFITVNPPGAIAKVQNGRLADVAPTLLDLLGLPKPAAMTGHSLIVPDQGRRAAE